MKNQGKRLDQQFNNAKIGFISFLAMLILLGIVIISKYIP